MGLGDWMLHALSDFLQKPVGHYEQRGYNDFERLKEVSRKGDVLLVEGDQRVSAIIKLLTHSSWSHAALYIGDELLRRDDTREHALERFGDESAHMVVEALADGVVASPLSKYIDFNVRVARPHRLHPSDIEKLLNDAIESIGWRYDVRNIIDLAGHLLRSALRPHTKLRPRLRLGSEASTEVICTSLLGRLFHNVRFPVLPSVTFPDGAASKLRPSRRSIGAWLRRERKSYSGRFRRRHPTLLTPRDFDLSPYFEVVKFNFIEGRHFDYHRIEWEDDPASDADDT